MKAKWINWEIPEERKKKLVLKTICNDRPISIYKSSYIDETECGSDLEIAVFTAWFTDKGKKERLATIDINTFFHVGLGYNNWSSLFVDADNISVHFCEMIEQVFFNEDDDECVDLKYNIEDYDYVVYLSNLKVDDKFRGQGFGKHLINCISDFVRNCPYEVMYSVKPCPTEIDYEKEKERYNLEKEKLISIYQSCGFKRMNQSNIFIFNF